MGSIYAVVVAAGKSTRMGAGVDKQLLALNGQPVLARSVAVLEKASGISGIILVVAPNAVTRYQGLINEWGCCKVAAVVSGGESRQDSVCAGLSALPEDTSLVLIHDGARPLVKPEHVEDVLEAAARFDAATLAVPTKDTVKSSDADGFVVQTIPRETLWLVQTPQAFAYPLLMQAHRWAVQKGFIGTDDASLVEAMGGRVKLVQGSYSNIKITTPEDVAVAEALIGFG